MARRILLYSHDTVGLGHIQRVSAIGRKLATESPEDTVLILTGSRVSGALSLPDNVDMVKLPAWRKISNDRYASRHLRIEDDRIRDLRASLISQTFEHFAPDIFIVDKAPVGVAGELRPTLEIAKTRFPRCRVILSLRDILDDPAEVRRAFEREGTFDALRRYYELLLVWGEQRVYDMVREYDLPEDIAAKLRYCGYIGPEKATEPAPRRRKRKKMVLVTVGGGQDGYDLLDNYVRSLSHVSRRFASVILTGPDLPADRRKELAERVQEFDGPLFLVEYTRHVDRLVRSADLVVAMGGYNTMCEVVSRGRPAVVVPRTSPRQEQVLRARRWEELGLLRMLLPDDLTPETLARVIDEEIARPRPAGGESLDFGGLVRAAKILRPDFRGAVHNPDPGTAQAAGS